MPDPPQAFPNRLATESCPARRPNSPRVSSVCIAVPLNNINLHLGPAADRGERMRMLT
jgi:hypothetical protein